VVLDRSSAYLEAEPLFAQGHIEVLDHPTLIRELRMLERRLQAGGKDRVDHPRGQHDDHANALALAAATISAQPKGWGFLPPSVIVMPTSAEKARAFMTRGNEDGSIVVRTKFGLEWYRDPRGM
jgi:hypothetical protein